MNDEFGWPLKGPPNDLLDVGYTIEKTKPKSTPTAITGRLGLLPTELIDKIAAALLALPKAYGLYKWFFVHTQQAKRQTLRDLGAFVQTCRGVLEALDPWFLVEATCRASLLRYRVLPAPGIPFPCSIRLSQMILDGFQGRAMRMAIHAGVLTATHPLHERGRSERERTNQAYEKEFALEAYPDDCVFRGILKFFGKMRVSLVAPPNARLVCGTRNGAILADETKIWHVHGSKPAEEFTPGQEHAITFSTSVWLHGPSLADYNVEWAAADDWNNIAVCTRPLREDGKTPGLSVTVWSEGGARPRGTFHVHETIHFPDIDWYNPPRKMWMHDNKVWLVLGSPTHQDEQETVRLTFVSIDLITKGVPHVFVERHVCYNVGSMSVASSTGQLAFLETVKDDEASSDLYFECLRFFDSTRRGATEKLCTVDMLCCGELLAQEPSAVVLSPDGCSMVTLIRQCQRVRGAEVRVYRRTGGYTFCNTEDKMDWFCELCDSEIAQNIRGRFNDWALSHPLSDATFSPGSNEIYFFFRGHEGRTGGIASLDINDAIRHPSSHTWRQVSLPDHDVPRKVVWTNGIFTQPAHQGVVRTGPVK